MEKINKERTRLGNKNSRKEIVHKNVTLSMLAERLGTSRQALYDRADKLEIDVYSLAILLDTIDYSLAMATSNESTVSSECKAKISNYLNNRPGLSQRYKIYKDIIGDIDAYSTNTQGFDKTLIYLLSIAKI